MTRAQWEHVKAILGDAFERKPAERESFVREAAKDDADLLAELVRLLKEDERDTDLLSEPALASARAWSRDEPPRFAPSTVLAGRFRIVRFIARGGMGEVYEAEDLDLGERIALKVIRKRVASDADLRALFKREIQLARRVTHPNVCRIFDLHEDSGNDEPILLLSMELIEGQTLAEYLRQNGPLAFRDALPLIEDIATGLQAVHDAGIIHGDLKPGNVMLVFRSGESPRARVMDFGVALPRAHAAAPLSELSGRQEWAPSGRAPGGDQSMVSLRPSSPVVRGGTPDYLAPEQTQGTLATIATDVYALALVIADMLGVPRAKRLKPDAERMPAPWASILRRSLESDPARRYTRPADVATALRASLKLPARTRRIALATAFSMLVVLIAATRIDLRRHMANGLVFAETFAETAQAPSPDGKFLAGTSWDTGDLILREVNSGKVRRLTHKSSTWANQFGGVYGALFSPDSRQIAYVWANSRTDYEIRIVGTNGKGERTLYQRPDTYPGLMDWSSDGSRILFGLADSTGKPQQVAMLTVQDGSVQALQKPSAGAHALFGADGNTIIFDAKAGPNAPSEIHRLSPAGAESRLIGPTGSNSVIGWMPDRRRLIFVSDRNRGEPGIWAVAVSDRGAEGEAEELVPNTRNWEPLGITSSGSLFYRQSSNLPDVYTAVLDLAAGRTISPPQRVFERFTGSSAFPNWSEDGRQLVFNSNHEPSTARVGIYEPQSGQMRELALNLTFVRRPQWVGHGLAIMVSGIAPGGRQGLFRVDPKSGQATLFRSRQDLESFYEGVWSRDGRFHWNRYDDARRGIFRLNVETDERRVLYVPPPGVDVELENLALSPDGRTLAFHARKEGGTASLMLMPSEGGNARPLFTVRSPQSFRFGSFTWTPDSLRILAVISNPGRSPKEESVSEIWQVPVDGSAPTKIDFPALPVVTLRMNPDGKTVAFHSPRWRSEVWVLQNFL
jgi:Tol biopolymer transport system component